jgi:hypothetical protein
MARHLFGGDWYIADAAGNVIPSSSITFWDSETSGAQYIDVLTAGGGALGGGIIPTDTAGKAHFQGPDAVSQGYIDAGLGVRFLIDSVDLMARIVALEAVIGTAPALIAQLATFESRLEAVEAAAPTSASGIVVNTAGGLTGPSAQTALDALLARIVDDETIS